MTERKIRVLIVAFSDSIHTARWLKHIDPIKFEVNLFPSVPFKSIHSEIQNTRVHLLISQNDSAIRNNVTFEYLYPFLEKLSIVFGNSIMKRLIKKWSVKKMQRKALIRVIKNVRPDVIHTMESQQAGYLYDEAIDSFYPRLPWIHSIWGIDIHFYEHSLFHKSKLKNLFCNISCLIVEGERDLLLARNLGFMGEVRIIPSVGGGIDFNEINKLTHRLPSSQRKKILLKGYEEHERLASTALIALRKLPHVLIGYEVIIYSCSKKLLPLIDEILNKNEFQISYVFDTTRAHLLKLTSDARISITNNLSDGVPNTMLEAMALGAFPIQSNTAITKGWIEDGVNGLLTDPNDASQIASAVSRALKDDELVDNAAIYNAKMVREKLNFHEIKLQIEDLYKMISENNSRSN